MLQTHLTTLTGDFRRPLRVLVVLFYANVVLCGVAPPMCKQGVTAALTGSLQARAGEVPFSQQVIDNAVVSYQRAVGDLDGDGDNDIVAINDGDELHWYAAPNWPRQILLKLQVNTHGYGLFRGDDMKIADIDGDGDLDAVARIGDDTEIGGKVVWFRNPRPGAPVNGVWSMFDIGANEYMKDMVIRDFDRDGKPDVVTREDSRTQVWFQNTPASWTRKEISHPSHEGMDVGDLDGDGDPDIVLNGYWLETPASPRTGTYAQHNIDSRWFTNQPSGWQAYSCKVVVADIDGNGKRDVVFSHSELPGFPVSWYSATDPKGTWAEHVITPACDYCHNLQAADFDGDGSPDVLAGGMIQSTHRGLTVYLGNGGGTWAPAPIQSMGSYSAELGDIDEDGDLDIVGVRQWNQPPTEIWRNQSAPSSGNPPVIDVADGRHPVSRVTHGSAGDFDVDLRGPGGGDTAVESRAGGPVRFLVTFTRPVQGVDGLDPTDVTLLSSTAGEVFASDVSLGGLTLTIHAAALPEGRLTLSFPGLADASDAGSPVADTLCVSVLPGDVTADETVNIFDMVITRNVLDATVDATRFRSDINHDGAINIFDLVVIRNNLNHFTSDPCP